MSWMNLSKPHMLIFLWPQMPQPAKHFNYDDMINWLTHWGWVQMAALLETILKIPFYSWKLLNFEQNVIEIYYLRSNWQQVSIGLAPNRQHAFIRTNDGLSYWRMYATYMRLRWVTNKTIYLNWLNLFKIINQLLIVPLPFFSNSQ